MVSGAPVLQNTMAVLNQLQLANYKIIRKRIKFYCEVFRISENENDGTQKLRQINLTELKDEILYH